ncbi:hypothetical protein BDZ89DRAFT_1147474 [Hymenopellis radicata]|nr:hypothetical protein BDZ89DRAFT_1147474 [Hymenopellis radicata]
MLPTLGIHIYIERPRKVTHPGSRPMVYHTEDTRKAAHKCSRDRWYFMKIHGRHPLKHHNLGYLIEGHYRVHGRVKKKMRVRYKAQGDAQGVGQKEECTIGGAGISQPDPSEPHATALQSARKLQKRFAMYIQTSENVFLRNTVHLVMDQYTSGEAFPLLDCIQEDLGEMDGQLQACLNELLNTVGA